MGGEADGIAAGHNEAVRHRAGGRRRQGVLPDRRVEGAAGGGVRIRGIAGASVGALNGALMCMDDLEHAEYIWENIAYSKVMDIDDELMDQLKNGRLRDLKLKAVAENALRLLKEGGI